MMIFLETPNAQSSKKGVRLAICLRTSQIDFFVSKISYVGENSAKTAKIQKLTKLNTRMQKRKKKKEEQKNTFIFHT